jgi:hypothetical protein
MPSADAVAIRYATLWLTCTQINVFKFHGSVHCKNIPIYIQQDATLHSSFYLETVLHVSGCTTTHYQERKQLYLQHLVFVRPLLLPAAIVEELKLQAIFRLQHQYRETTLRHDS